MPIQNGKYVAPTWTNNAPPAIDANELNAMSQSIQNNYPAIIGTVQAGEDLDFLDVVDINDGIATKTMSSEISVNYAGSGGVSGQQSGNAIPFCADYGLDLYVTVGSSTNNDTLYFSFINREDGVQKFNGSFDITTISNATYYSNVVCGIPLKISSGVVAVPFTAFRESYYNKFGILIIKYGSSSITSTYGYFDSTDNLGSSSSSYTYYFKSCYSSTNNAIITMIARSEYTYGSYIFVTFINTSTYQVRNNIFLNSTSNQFIAGNHYIGFDLCMYDNTHCIAVGYSITNDKFYNLILQEITLSSSSASYGYSGTLYTGGTAMSDANVCLYKSNTSGDVYVLFKIMKSSQSTSSALMFSKIVKSGSVYNSISSSSTEISTGTVISSNLPTISYNDIYYSCYTYNGTSSIIKIDTTEENVEILDIGISGGMYDYNFVYLNYIYTINGQYPNTSPIVSYTINNINMSKDAISTSSVSSGNNVDVVYGGIYKNDSINVGTKIITDGVIAESFEQGSLSVVQKTENNSYSTYITTGSSNQSVININCGFVPNMISIICTSYGGSSSSNYNKCYIIYRDFYISYNSNSSYSPNISNVIDFIYMSENGFYILGKKLDVSSTYKICAYKY